MKNKLIKTLFALSLGFAAVGASFLSLVNGDYSITHATYENGDADTYYNGISSSATGTTLLSSLRTLNNSKRRSTVGYDGMGTSSSDQFKYTDYDPSNYKTDSNGQPCANGYVLSFYSGTHTSSFNREHVWPNSHGGNVVENDIHMPRPTISSENGSRGNSFYVEGMKSSSNGWDPAMESFGVESYRGDSARIIFYCCVASSQLSLIDDSYHSTSNANKDYLMGKLSDLLKWNLEYPVLQREKNRNEGAEYLQGNRNPFIDHPEYACKIWGDTNTTTKEICAAYSTAPKTITISPSSATLAVGGETYLTANVDSGSSLVTWSSSDSSVATVSSNGYVKAVKEGTVTITAASQVDANVKGTATINVKAVSSISLSGTPTKTEYLVGEEFDPTGLTVTAHFTDSTTQTVDNSLCFWFDGTNGYTETLELGTTSVDCWYGSTSAKYTGITVSEKTLSNTYTLVTSTDDLVAGSSIILAYNSGNIVAGDLSSAYLTSTSATFSTDKETITNIGSAIELTLGKSGNNYTFANSSGKLLGATAVKKLAFGSGTTTWSVSFSEDDALITNTTSGYGTMKYNTSSPRFTTYASGQNPIQIYAKAGNVTPTITSLTLDKSSVSLNVGETSTITPTFEGTGSYTKGLTWVSNNTSVATVSNGVVTAVAAGTATITATSTFDTTKSASCNITVSQSVASSSYTLTYKNAGTYHSFTLSDISSYINGLDSGLVVTSVNNVRAGSSPDTSAFMFGGSSNGASLGLCLTDNSKIISKVTISGRCFSTSTISTLDINSLQYDTTTSYQTFVFYPLTQQITIESINYRTFISSIVIDVIDLTDGANEYGVIFKELTNTGCANHNVSSDTWSTLKTIYNNADTTVQSDIYTDTGDDIVEALERYSNIIANYGYEDFLNLAPSSNRVRLFSQSNDYSLVMFTLISISSFAGLYILLKTKKKKSE